VDRVVSAERLVLGTVQWGLPSYGIANRTGRPDEGEVARILASAKAAGVHVVDTARAYGESEDVLGRLIGAEPGWEIVTKLPRLESEDVRREVGTHLSRSRRALRRERLDFVLLHHAADRTRVVWTELLERCAAGEIGAIGVSTNTPEEALAALEDPTVAALQVPYNLLDQRLRRCGFFARAAQRKIRIFVRSVYLQGVAHLRRDALPRHLEPLRPALADIEDWARRHGLTVPETFLLFVRDTVPHSVVLGTETSAQWEENLRIWRMEWPAADIQALASMVPDLPATVLSPALWQR
jgi:aryl-alcohol dehydrogenase-like predicted oxidoreductase